MSSKEVKIPFGENRNLRDGEYLLTYSQIFTLNRKMPKGWKIELFENMAKFESYSKPQLQIKRPRSSNIIKDYSDEDEESIRKKKMKKTDHDYHSKESSLSSNNNSSYKTSNKRLREKKPNNIIKELDSVETEKKIKLNPNLESCRKCEKVFNKLKKHPLCDYFLNQNIDQNSLSSIEKKIKNNTYSSSFQFGMDIRAIWNYHFSQSTINSDIYQKTFTLSNYFEEIFKDIENTTEEKRDFHELQKKVTKLQEKFNTLNKNSTSNNIVKRERSYSTSEKPMTTSEKNQLANKIKMLNHDQLKGIIKIVSDSLTLVDPNSKYFEFDIETLQTKKLRELEKYVKNCLKAKSNQTPVQNTQIIGNLSTNPTAKDNIKKTNSLGTNPHSVSNNQNQVKNNNTNNNPSLKQHLKKPFEEDEIIPKLNIPKNDSLLIKEHVKYEDKRVDYHNEKDSNYKMAKNELNTNTNSSIDKSSEIKNKAVEIIQAKDSNKKEDKSDFDSESESDSDSESLSELDFSKKTNKVN